MCKLEDGFKLCTCLDEKGIEAEPDAPVWRLRRINPLLPEKRRIGKFRFSALTMHEEERREKILEQLNQRNCFDFDYSPQKDDHLMIKFSGSDFLSYRYNELSNSWEIDHTPPFVGWKTQLERLDNGK